MNVVPLTPVPSQTVSTTLGGQACRINVRTARTGLYLDLYVNGVLVAGGVICQHATRLVRAVYAGFVGELAFFDLQGSDDPVYTGLGSRWVLGYLP